MVSKGDKSAKEKKEAEEAAKQAASQAANQESLKAALSKLTKDSLAKGEPMFKKAWAKFQEAIDMLPEEEKNKPLKPQQVLLLEPNSAYHSKQISQCVTIQAPFRGQGGSRVHWPSRSWLLHRRYRPSGVGHL